jgi:hypothetical protein
MNELLTKGSEWLRPFDPNLLRYASAYIQELFQKPLFVRSYDASEKIDAKDLGITFKTRREFLAVLQNYDITSLLGETVLDAILVELDQGRIVVLSERIKEQSYRWKNSTSSGREGGH